MATLQQITNWLVTDQKISVSHWDVAGGPAEKVYLQIDGSKVYAYNEDIPAIKSFICRISRLDTDPDFAAHMVAQDWQLYT